MKNEAIRQISPAELFARLNKHEPLTLLDVREHFEREQFNIGGQHIPLGNIMAEADSIPKETEVILYCKMGIRSQIAIQRLKDRFGFTNLVNLQGGMEAWKREMKELK